MGSSDILIMDLDPILCSVDLGSQIGELLPKLLPDSAIFTQTGINAPSETDTSFSPAGMLLKPCIAEKLHRAIRTLEKEWRTNSNIIQRNRKIHEKRKERKNA